MVFFDKIGFPIFRKDNKLPPIPINAPPTPTKENSPGVFPEKLNNSGTRKMIIPDMP